MDRLAEEMLGEDSSMMARMQKKFWKTKQVLIKATGKKEDEYVVASDADLDAKLEFFRSVQSTCTVLLKVIEKYQFRITRLSQEENELGLFLRFQAEHDRTKAGNMMDATSKALCTSAKQRMALCPPLQRLYQEVETFRRRAIGDMLLTVGHMEKSRTEYRGALLWMKDASQELDPDTYKQLEKFRKVQAQVRGTKSQFEKLKNDVCQKVDMLGASRCNMLSHSLCTYQTTLLQFWERTALAMSGIQRSFQGHVDYQFTTLKDLRDPLELISDPQKEEEEDKNTDNLIQQEVNALPVFTYDLVSLEDEKPKGSGSAADPSNDLTSPNSDGVCTPPPARHALSGPLLSFQDQDLMLMTSDDPLTLALPPTTAPILPLLALGASLQPVSGGALSHPPASSVREQEEEEERSDMAFLKDLLSPGPGASDDFSREWHDAFGAFEPPATSPVSGGEVAAGGRPPSRPLSPASSFLPSQLLDHSLSATGWATPPMFQAPPMQSPPGPNQPTQPTPDPKAKALPAGGSKDMSAWFNLFADLDPLSNPDAIGRSADELLNA